jgi:pimeloyl-ACP methyl ester carboxylesterase
MRIRGTELLVRESGSPDGVPVVLLHGFPFDHTLWDPQVAALADGFRVLAYDARAHGRSGGADAPFAFEEFVDDLLGILDGHRIGRAVLVGLSMGGYAVLRFAEREPGRVRALVLADTKSAADDDAARLARAAGARKAREEGPAAFAEGFLPKALAKRTMEARPGVVEKVRGMILGCSAAGIAGTLVAMAGRTDTTAALPGIRVPTLVLVGAEDALTPPAAARALAAAIPGARLVEIPGAAHLPNLEEPAAFNAALLPFLRSV